MLFFAELKQGVGIQSLLAFVVGILPLTIFAASFVNKKAEWKLTRFDLRCGALSLVGLILWYMTKSGNVAIIFNILADGLAALPTIVKSYNHPETESAWPYFTSMVFGVITVLTVKEWFDLSRETRMVVEKDQHLSQLDVLRSFPRQFSLKSGTLRSFSLTHPIKKE